MSDTWEQQFFQTISPNRTRFTDTDSDGFPDYAEFIAGTNPILTNSYLRLFHPIPQSNDTILLQWPSVAGHAYQVQATLNFRGWGPLTGWLQSTGGMMSVTVPTPGPPVTHHNYRLEVRP
jgi:hypothetical protein